MDVRDEKSKIWMNGKFIPWHEATIHVMSHVIHYGSSVFEGLRCYDTPKGPMIFRLKEHIRRLFDSAKIYRMNVPFSQQEIIQACNDIIKVNNFPAAYLRPVVYRGYFSLGVDPRKCPVDVAIGALNWGKYLGDEALATGVDVRISSWQRFAPNTLPALAKASGNYMNSALIKQEANADNYVEGIALDINGYVSEGSGENIFAVRDGIVYTPQLSASILSGITRDSVIRICAELSLPVRETLIPREQLYLSDEVFFTGSAAEITPIRSIDHYVIGAGKCGPVAAQLQKRFFEYINGECEDRYGWNHYVQ
ncbi:MAG TPA: branched-chain amino acid transaminase [bacterium]|nr:branched-chain amino acid transaminase [bacterium]HPR87868.1 branched-chain amino acid transaminase [bacterium]